tara:strand:+ start:444 stop:671 length:228 start_codon:yes stop_codon:yes gene_type:complete
VKVLDGEKAYNDANLDQYLMGIQRVKINKKEAPQRVPSINELNHIHKLTKMDESFHMHYAAISQKKAKMAEMAEN